VLQLLQERNPVVNRGLPVLCCLSDALQKSEIKIFSIASCLHRQFTWFMTSIASCELFYPSFIGHHLLSVQFTIRLKSNLSTALMEQTTININDRTNPHQTTNCTSAQCIFNWNTSVNGHNHLTVRLHPAKTTAYIETVLVSSTQQM
jgi:hypothetical protein